MKSKKVIWLTPAVSVPRAVATGSFVVCKFQLIRSLPLAVLTRPYE